jgi:hypothetical protein
MLVGSFVKLLDEVKDYTLDWSDELVSDTISTSAWTISPTSSPPLVEDSETNDTTTTTIWLSGGMIGEDYTLENTIVTTGGRTCVATIEVRVSYLISELTAYIEAIAADSYFAKAQNTTWLALSAAAREGFIIRATRLLNRQSWVGDKTDDAQALAWPRSDTGVDGVTDTVIPQEIVDACAELALDIAEGSGVEDVANTAQKLQSIKAGSVALTYFRGAEGSPKRFPQSVHELLSKYLTGVGSLALTGVATGTDGGSVTDKGYGYNRGL